MATWPDITLVNSRDRARLANVKNSLQTVPKTPLGGGPPDAVDRPWTTADLIDVIAAHPANNPKRVSSVVADPSSDSPIISDVIRAGFEVLGAVPDLLYAGDAPFDGEALLEIAFGLDTASVLARTALLGQKFVADPPTPQPPGLPTEMLPLDVGHVATMELLQALQNFALAASQSNVSGYNQWATRATVNARGINGVDPFVVCPGDTLRILGRFPAAQPANTTVRLPTSAGCADAEVVDWSSKTIVVTVPPNVAPGAVGFLVTDGPPPPVDTVAASQAAQQVADILGDVGLLGGTGGAAASLIWQRVANTPPLTGLPCPAMLPRRKGDGRPANAIHGGPPVITTFTAAGDLRATLHPGDAVTIAWDVAGVDEVTLTAVNLPWQADDPPHELPAIPGPAKPIDSMTTGPLDESAFYDWRGAYRLDATNACGSVSGTVVVEMFEHAPLFGLADVHVHFTAHLASGGYAIFGTPHPADPMTTGDDAIRECLPTCDHGPRNHGAGGVLPSLDGGGSGHLVGGAWGADLAFDGWPRHNTLAHQETFIDWIKRAHDGGLRLVVCHANNSELLATRVLLRPGPAYPTPDSAAIDLQLDAMTAMATFVAAQTPAAELPWFVIVKTPQEARTAVSNGQLAMVLGVEVDSLGGWHTPDELDQQAIAENKTVDELVSTMVQDLFDKGVRHLFPVHGTNNAFGGPALFQTIYDPANVLATGLNFDVEPAPADLGVAWRLDDAADATDGIVLAAAYGISPTNLAATRAAYRLRWGPPTIDGVPNTSGHINKQGATAHMNVLLRQLMMRGMVIDIDHMGHKTTGAVLNEAELRHYPVVSGHAQFRELKPGYAAAKAGTPWDLANDDFGTRNPLWLSAEIDKSPETLLRIRALGGLVAPILIQNQSGQCSHGQGSVASNNPGSSRSLAQAIQYASFFLRGRGVATGSDVNGAAPLTSPRFGPNGSFYLPDDADFAKAHGRTRRDDVLAQRDGVLYASALREYRNARFPDSDPQMITAPFDGEERDAWEALAVVATGTRPDQMDHPATRLLATRSFIEDLAWGFRSAARTDLPDATNATQITGHLLRHPTARAQANDPPETAGLVLKLGTVVTHWDAMTAGTVQTRPRGIWGRSIPLYQGELLTRSQLGRRDYDINIDGMAHYGLLPDLLQDLSNVGADTDMLYRSAEDYIRVWERSLARSTQIP
jgi:hypothetical protein